MILVNRYSLLTHLLLLSYKSTFASATSSNKTNISEKIIVPMYNEAPNEIFSIPNLSTKKMSSFKQNELRGKDVSTHMLKNFNSNYKPIVFSPNRKPIKDEFPYNLTNKTFEMTIFKIRFLKMLKAFEIDDILSIEKMKNNTEIKKDWFNDDSKFFVKQNAESNDSDNNFRVEKYNENEEKSDDSIKFIQNLINIFNKYRHSDKFKRDNNVSILFANDEDYKTQQINGNNEDDYFDNNSSTDEDKSRCNLNFDKKIQAQNIELIFNNKNGVNFSFVIVVRPRHKTKVVDC